MGLFSGDLEQISIPPAKPGTGASWHNVMSLLEPYTYIWRVSCLLHETHWGSETVGETVGQIAALYFLFQTFLGNYPLE